MKMMIPCYPCDKELFPGSQLSPEDERESTTFYSDFKIAEAFGLGAVKDTFKRAFGEWKNNIKYITELAVVTNHLGWQHQADEPAWADFYFKAYQKCCNYVYQCDADGNNTGPFTDKEVIFFHEVLD